MLVPLKEAVTIKLLPATESDEPNSRVTLICVFTGAECAGLTCYGCTSLSTVSRTWVLHEDLDALEIRPWLWVLPLVVEEVGGSDSPCAWPISPYRSQHTLGVALTSYPLSLLLNNQNRFTFSFPCGRSRPPQRRRETFSFRTFDPVVNTHEWITIVCVEDSPYTVHLWISSERKPQLYCIERGLSHARCWCSKLRFTFEVCKPCVELCIEGIQKPDLRPVSQEGWRTRLIEKWYLVGFYWEALWTVPSTLTWFFFALFFILFLWMISTSSYVFIFACKNFFSLICL